MAFISTRTCLVIAAMLGLASTLAAAEVHLITPNAEPALAGKEIDWIYGDYLMKNDHVTLVIAAPLATRDANLTVRAIGGSILDLTLNQPSNDQLSAYMPTAGRYLFHDPTKIKIGRDGETAFWECHSSKSVANDGTAATVRYTLSNGNPFVESTVTIHGDKAGSVAPFDGIRADGDFSFKSFAGTAYCTDTFFRQTIGFKVPGTQQSPAWKRGRPHQLQYRNVHVERTKGKLQWTVRLYPATSPIDLFAVSQDSNPTPAMYTFRVTTKAKPPEGFDTVHRAKIVLRTADETNTQQPQRFTLQTDDQGIAHARVAPGKYTAKASALGYDSVELDFVAQGKGGSVDFPLAAPRGVCAVVTDGQGNPIPVKATIYALDGPQPNFGPASTRTLVQNCVYSVHGQFCCPLTPGKYEIYFSHGPEYTSVSKQVEIDAEGLTTLNVQLKCVVDTPGWVSADLHSHSSPSGDNTSDQYGRVENLLCEHLEFAPCTEHNRISSYVPHLQQMQLVHRMATCSGIELTGSPLPVNHQNAFPLHRHPHTQNGGGPRTSPNPVVQIERLAMWDDGAEKVVQMNHPNLHQIFGDANTDGNPDKVFRAMLHWADVIEVHPLETIFQDVASNPPHVRKMRIPIFQWMQLLNQGHRVPGAINTDAHYNHHGSGWRRIWIASSTDDPAKISTEEMVCQVEAGHIVMSTGPFLSVTGVSSSSTKPAIPGDDLAAPDGKVTLQVSVQCPNWMDVNRVQVLINGRPSKKHNYLRRSAPDRFGKLDTARKFDATLNLTLEHDAHLIVATIGEGVSMEKITGRRNPPIAVSNPIFVDVDGKGFQPNGDELGLPLPRTPHEADGHTH